MALAGLDIGTTGCKVTVYDDEGKFLYRGYQEYPISRSTGEHEIRAEVIWESVKQVLAGMGETFWDIHAMGVTSFGETCVLLDKNDDPVRPAMLYTDPRGAEECSYLTEKVGREKLQSITGLNPHSMYSIPKIMWIKRHCPGDYERAFRILMMEDYIVYMLTGEAVIDYSLAARSMGFDIRNMEWSREIFQAAGLNAGLFSQPVIGGTTAGKVKKELAVELGITPELLILPAGHDQVAAAVGAGIFDQDTAVDGAGTVECITPVYEGIPRGQEMYRGNYAIVPYVVPGRYLTYAFSFTGGGLVSWFIRNLAKWESSVSREHGIAVYDILEQEMKDEPTGILVLPYFAGAATPYMDEGAKGAVVGLTLEHSAADLYRAVLEGVVYEIRLNMEYLEQAGICPRYLRAAGGGTASGIWMQMRADILGVPVTVLDHAEAGAAGCAMMAGAAAGLYPNLYAAAESFVREHKTYYPREEQHEAYEEHYKRYRGLYRAVRPLM